MPSEKDVLELMQQHNRFLKKDQKQARVTDVASDKIAEIKFEFQRQIMKTRTLLSTDDADERRFKGVFSRRLEYAG